MTNRHPFTLLSTFTLALAGCAGEDVPPDVAAPPESPATRVARAHLAEVIPEIATTDLAVTRERTDAIGMTHVRQQQLVDGVPVLGGEAIVHLGVDGTVRHVTDALIRDLAVDTTPSITADDAIVAALDATIGADVVTARPPVAELRILRDDAGDHLVWRVELEHLPDDDAELWTQPLVLVDAHGGGVLRVTERILDATTNGTGTARYAGSVGFKVWEHDDGKFYLEDNARDLGVFNLQNQGQSAGVARFSDGDNVWTSDTTAVQAHWALARTWDYYRSVFDRLGIDGSNGPGNIPAKSGQGALQSAKVHWGVNTSNAKWVDPFMVFGDGDAGSDWDPLVSLDIVAHEFAHGVTSREAGLDGSNETPALHEHLSDVFGAAVEAHQAGGVNANTWRLGEQAITPNVAGDALRYLDDPARDGISLDYWTSTLDQEDGHDGAGVGNLAFYLTVMGGDHPRRASAHVTGVGIDQAQRVWYRALTEYLTSTANYSALRNATLRAAADLYGAGYAAYRALHSAWEAVGIPSVTCPGFADDEYGNIAPGAATLQPSAAGFWSADGSVVGFLGHDQTDDFDLELWRYYPSTNLWVKVKDAVGPGNNEVFGYSSGTGTQYRWRVKATSGDGAYNVCWNP
jgi:Zn-dependent metalloprotease